MPPNEPCAASPSAERAWLFAGSDRGGERAAVMYTLIVTAKLNDVDPQAWLADVLARIADHPASRLDELLPGTGSSAPVPVRSPDVPQASAKVDDCRSHLHHLVAGREATMDDEAFLRAKLRKLEALFVGAGTPGEKAAAEAGLETYPRPAGRTRAQRSSN